MWKTKAVEMFQPFFPQHPIYLADARELPGIIDVAEGPYGITSLSPPVG